MPRRRRTTYRKKRRTKRRTSLKLYRSPTSTKVGYLRCFQMVQLPATVLPETQNPSWQARAITFSLDQIPAANLNAFVRLFRMYRIKSAKVFFKPVQTDPAPAGAVVTYNGMACSFYSSIIPNGEQMLNIWPSQDVAQQVSNVKLRYFGNTLTRNKPIYTRKLIPRVNDMIYTQVGANPVVPIVGLPRSKNWLNVKGAIGNAEHYGLQCGWQWDQGHPGMEIQVSIQYELEFKGVQ